MPEFLIDIDVDGSVRVEGKDFTGKECEALSAELEKALGDVTKKKFKPEFFRQAQVTRKAGA